MNECVRVGRGENECVRMRDGVRCEWKIGVTEREVEG